MNNRFFNTLFFLLSLSALSFLGLKSQFVVDSNPHFFKPGLTEHQVLGLKYFSFVSNTRAKSFKKFYIQAALHGNEKLTTEFVYWLAQSLNNGSSTLLGLNLETSGIQIDLVPIANPNGYKKGSRYNSNHVNLNRNFPVFWGLTQENPGLYSLSEPETQAIAKIFAKSSYTAAIDIHGFTNMIVTPSHYKNSSTYEKWLKAVEKTTKKHLSVYAVKNGKDLGDGGAFEDWAFWQKGTPALCLEMIKSSRFISNSAIGEPKEIIDTFKIYENYIRAIFSEADLLNSAPMNTSLADDSHPSQNISPGTLFMSQGNSLEKDSTQQLSLKQQIFKVPSKDTIH